MASLLRNGALAQARAYNVARLVGAPHMARIAFAHTTAGNIASMGQQALIDQLARDQVASANRLVPWFTTSMPKPYFTQVCQSLKNS
jgi:hypothetical protein